MTRVAAVDCGTNSVRLLVADLLPGGGLRDVAREMRITRLGQGVDRTGRFAPDALERTAAALHEYGRLVRGHGATRVRMAATSAARDAANRDELEHLARAALGVTPEVVTGEEEAALTFAGAAGGLAAAGAARVVADIGGGSTELVLGADRAERAVSVDVGCVRLTERHLHDDPPGPEQVAAARADVDRALESAGGLLDAARGCGATLVGVAGTVTTVAALALGLDAYDPQRIHGSRVAAADVHAWTDRLLRLPRTERAALPPMHPGRVDVIAAGALVLDALVRRTGADEVLVSEHDILDGIALSLR